MNQFDFVGLVLVLIMVVCGLLNVFYEVYRKYKKRKGACLGLGGWVWRVAKQIEVVICVF